MKEIKYYIYSIQNKHNNKMYIGMSANCIARWEAEKFRAFNLKSLEYNYPISRAFRKYAKEKDKVEDFFTFQILESFDNKQECEDAEKYWIAFFRTNIYRFGKNSGYNQTDGGDGVIGKPCSEEIKVLLSKKLKGKIPWNKNKPGIYTNEHRKKISDAVSGINHPFYGKNHTNETKAKVAKTKQQNSSANLNWDIVSSIRSEYIPEQISMNYLANKYKIGLTTVYKIIHFITWKLNEQ